MWGGMVEYWHYTGDTSYNDVVAQAILAQASPTNDFMMPEEAGQLVCTCSSLFRSDERKERGAWIDYEEFRATTTKSSGASPP